MGPELLRRGNRGQAILRFGCFHSSKTNWGFDIGPPNYRLNRLGPDLKYPISNCPMVGRKPMELHRPEFRFPLDHLQQSKEVVSIKQRRHVVDMSTN